MNDPNYEWLTNGKAQKYENAYGEYINICAESLKKKYNYEWTQSDTLAFGEYCANWEDYRPILEADITSRNALGDAINTNLGLIAMAYSALPIQYLASVQPLNDEAGTVFFRKGVANATRGSISKDDTLVGSYGDINKDISSYVSETVVDSVTLINDSSSVLELDYTKTLGKEIKPGSLKITGGSGKFKAMDDGEGVIIGNLIDGTDSTINYATGALVLKLANVDGTSPEVSKDDKLDITYQQSTIAAETVPSMRWVLTSKVLTADYYVLESQYSNLSEMVLRKRFGADLAEQVSSDLVSQITSAVMNRVIKLLRDAAIRTETASGTTISWASAPGTGVAVVDHRKTFEDKIIESVAVMYKQAGKGDVSAIITGQKGRQILRTAGMKMIKNSVAGPHLTGMLDNIPVYYAPNTVITDDEILTVYRGANWYEAPIVYAPFLPVTSVSGRAVSQVLVNANACYHSAAMDSVNDGFVTRINIT